MDAMLIQSDQHRLRRLRLEEIMVRPMSSPDGIALKKISQNLRCFPDFVGERNLSVI